jgi:hypothetical protein
MEALSSYWANPAPVDKRNTIDMTSLIMDAMDSPDSVIDITNQIEKMAENDPDSSSP